MLLLRIGFAPGLTHCQLWAMGEGAMLEVSLIPFLTQRLLPDAYSIVDRAIKLICACISN